MYNNSDIDPSGINSRGKRTIIIIKREKKTEWILEMGKLRCG